MIIVNCKMGCHLMECWQARWPVVIGHCTNICRGSEGFIWP